jgi:hypothetical protein
MNKPNPYAPPAAAVSDAPAHTVVSPEPVFFAVSIPKLLLMSTCTLGVYPIYWFYRNWTLIAYQERLAIMPLMRGIFAIFFCHGCFRRIRDFEHAGVSARSVPAGLLAAGYIVANIAWRLPGSFMLIGFTAPLFLIPVQRRANEINTAIEPAHDRNSRFTPLNWVALIVGGLLVVLAIIGTLLPGE